MRRGTVFLLELTLALSIALSVAFCIKLLAEMG